MFGIVSNHNFINMCFVCLVNLNVFDSSISQLFNISFTLSEIHTYGLWISAMQGICFTHLLVSIPHFVNYYFARFVGHDIEIVLTIYWMNVCIYQYPVSVNVSNWNSMSKKNVFTIMLGIVNIVLNQWPSDLAANTIYSWLHYHWIVWRTLTKCNFH